MKVTTDACLFGAFAANEISRLPISGKKILDLGAGTGLLSLMVAQQVPDATIDAIEIDKDAFEQSKANIAGSAWSDRINIYHGDAITFEYSTQYDVILSNPPFYEKELKGDNSKKNKAHHDESLNLKDLLAVIRKNLSRDGIFFLLLPYKRNEEIRKLVLDHEFELLKLLFIRQSVKHDYFRIILAGKLKSGEPGETELNEIAIADENKNYTGEFITLLNDYYLHL
jgi:tRNA1Val (adenine37-N6)-methyltransferase